MIGLVLLAQLASAPPPLRFELPNGLRVWVQEDHARPVALVQVTYDVGSLHEGPGTTGIAHYVEHMVYRATENIRNEDAYGYIDRIGGRYTGGTWPNFTRYAETVPSWALEAALRVTAERMSRARFDSLEFERERTNVVTEANGFRESDALSALRDAVMAASFEVHPYRYSSNTWAQDNLRLTRRQAYDWYKRYYGPNNAVLVVVGDVVADSVRRLVETHFGSLPPAPGSGAIEVIEPPQLTEKRVTLRHAGEKQQIEIVYRAPPARQADFPVLVALDRMLTPALARVARETGAEVTSKDSATAYPFVYRISVSTDSSANLERLLAAIDREIDALRSGALAGPVVAGAAVRPRRGEGEIANPNLPPRQSSLTRIAGQLSDRERPSWEVGEATLDSIGKAAELVKVADIRAYAARWLRPEQRTVGLLIRGPGHFAQQRLDVPALTTPPARRLTPDPVPPRALQPLGPIAIERTRRVLPNGIPIRAGRAPGDLVAVRVLVDRGDGVDTILRSFPVARLDSGLAATADRVRALSAPRAKADPDTSLSARARERLLAGIAAAQTTSAPVSTTVAAAGPVVPGTLADAVAKHFTGLPRNLDPRLKGPPARVDAGSERIAVPGAPQVTILAGLPGVPRAHPDRRALELLNYIVGVPWYGGRLGWALTKSGLTYSSAAATSFGAGSGHILFSTESDTRNAESTIQAITEVIAGIGENGVTGWELREAQAFTLGRTLLYGARERSPADAIALALSNSEDAGIDQLDLPGLSRAYLSVTLEDVNRVARAYYRGELLKVVAIGAIPAANQPRVFPPGTFRALFEP